MIESILDLKMESSYFSGCILGTIIQINKELGKQPYNFISGHYNPCETVTRFAVDDDGFVYVSISKEEEYILCYGRDGDILILGMGIDAKSAKEALLQNFGEEKTIQKIIRSQSSEEILKHEVKICFKKHEKISESVRLPLLPRNFTWHFGLGPTAKTIEILETEASMIKEGSFIFGKVTNNIYQEINNDFLLQLPVSKIDENIFFAKAKASIRNNNNEQFIIFANLQDNFDNQHWEAYESEKTHAGEYRK